MTARVDRYETRSARMHVTQRGGLTVANLRAFLADVETVDLPAGTPVRIEDKLLEGANHAITIEAQTRVTLDTEAAR